MCLCRHTETGSHMHKRVLLFKRLTSNEWIAPATDSLFANKEPAEVMACHYKAARWLRPKCLCGFSRCNSGSILDANPTSQRGHWARCRVQSWGKVLLKEIRASTFNRNHFPPCGTIKVKGVSPLVPPCSRHSFYHLKMWLSIYSTLHIHHSEAPLLSFEVIRRLHLCSVSLSFISFLGTPPPFASCIALWERCTLRAHSKPDSI